MNQTRWIVACVLVCVVVLALMACAMATNPVCLMHCEAQSTPPAAASAPQGASR